MCHIKPNCSYAVNTAVSVTLDAICHKTDSHWYWMSQKLKVANTEKSQTCKTILILHLIPWKQTEAWTGFRHKNEIKK